MAKPKKTPEQDFLQRMYWLKRSGLYDSPQLLPSSKLPIDELETLGERVNRVVEYIRNQKNRTTSQMYCFITYDIESNRIRRNVAKYLLRNGFIRVQFSVFFGDVDRKKFDAVHGTLKKINDMYFNSDSIFFIPFGDDVLHKTKVVGKKVDFELITQSTETLFI